MWGFLRVLMSKCPDISLPTFSTKSMFGCNIISTYSGNVSCPKNLGLGVIGGHWGLIFNVSLEIWDFKVWHKMCPGAPRVGLTKNSFFKHQLGMEGYWLQAKEIFDFQKFVKPNSQNPKNSQNPARSQNHIGPPLFSAFYDRIWKNIRKCISKSIFDFGSCLVSEKFKILDFTLFRAFCQMYSLKRPSKKPKIDHFSKMKWYNTSKMELEMSF